MTIKDIAKESGYSVSTVSRVLNNRRDVSPEAKKRISEIVAAHNFVPNNNAKHLKQSTSKNIVVLVKGTSNMLFANIVEEVQKMLEETKYSAEVCYMDEDKNEVEQALKRETDAQERIARDMEPVREEPSPATAPVREAAPATPVEPEAAPLPAAKPAAPASARKNGMDQPMDPEEFAQYACKYAADIDCSITGKSLLALYERIEMMEEDGEALTPKAAEDLIERAADKAEQPSLGKRLTSLFASKYDKEGYLILREDNFFDD